MFTTLLSKENPVKNQFQNSRKRQQQENTVEDIIKEDIQWTLTAGMDRI